MHATWLTLSFKQESSYCRINTTRHCYCYSWQCYSVVHYQWFRYLKHEQFIVGLQWSCSPAHQYWVLQPSPWNLINHGSLLYGLGLAHTLLELWQFIVGLQLSCSPAHIYSSWNMSSLLWVCNGHAAQPTYIVLEHGQFIVGLQWSCNPAHIVLD